MPAVAALAAALLAACGSAPRGLVDGRLELPGSLREVSGVTALDAATVACVQDERGAVFEVDLASGVVNARRFGARGDYEGIAKVVGGFWVLRSDGWLLRVTQGPSGLHVARECRLERSFDDWEGLCVLDERRLLVAPKVRAGGDESRPVLSFDTASGQLQAEPFAVFRRDSVAAVVGDRPGGRGPIELAVSDLLMAPDGSALLLLSAVDRLLVRVERSGRVLGHRWLEADGLTKPEGLTWLADGRLLVASEGRGGAGRLQIVLVP